MKDRCINSMRNGSYTSCVITGHLFNFNRKMRIVLYFDREPARLFRAMTANASLIPLRHPENDYKSYLETGTFFFKIITRF